LQLQPSQPQQNHQQTQQQQQQPPRVPSPSLLSRTVPPPAEPPRQRTPQPNLVSRPPSLHSRCHICPCTCLHLGASHSLLQHQRLLTQWEHTGTCGRRRPSAGRHASFHTAAHAAAAATCRCSTRHVLVIFSRLNARAGVPQLKIERVRPPQEQGKVATKQPPPLPSQQQVAARPASSDSQQQQQQQTRSKGGQSWT
jgi:hypothetical protein